MPQNNWKSNVKNIKCVRTKNAQVQQYQDKGYHFSLFTTAIPSVKAFRKFETHISTDTLRTAFGKTLLEILQNFAPVSLFFRVANTIDSFF